MRRVLITGAAGNLGRKLRRELTGKPGYELVPLDRDSGGDSAIIVADLSCSDANWTERFAGVDTVVHLAAEASPYADWPSLVRNNVDALLNVFAAAAAHRVRRIVFASSVHAMLGHAREPSAHITAAMETDPIDFYGATKVFGERLARDYALRHGLSAICLRLGWVPRDNAPERVARARPAVQHMWLSDRDFCGYVERAIAVDTPFAIVNATSRIARSTWDLDDGVRVLGYLPQDHWTPPRETVATNLRRALTNLIRRAMRRLER